MSAQIVGILIYINILRTQTSSHSPNSGCFVAQRLHYLRDTTLVSHLPHIDWPVPILTPQFTNLFYKYKFCLLEGQTVHSSPASHFATLRRQPCCSLHSTFLPRGKSTCLRQCVSMLARTGRPKLALALPTAKTTSHAMRSPALRSPLPPVSPSPTSPTARNTRLNQRGFSVMQPPTFAYAQSSETKSILKRGQKSNLTTGKKIQFQDDPAVMCLSPVPEDYHGTYVKMTRDERRWGKRA